MGVPATGQQKARCPMSVGRLPFSVVSNAENNEYPQTTQDVTAKRTDMVASSKEAVPLTAAVEVR